jgi:hypothetical protein
MTLNLLTSKFEKQNIVTRLSDRRRGIGLSTGFIAPYNQLQQH